MCCIVLLFFLNYSVLHFDLLGDLHTESELGEVNSGTVRLKLLAVNHPLKK